MEGHSVVFLDLNSLGSVECQKTLNEYGDSINCQFKFTPFYHSFATLQKVKAENVDFGLILTNDHPGIDVLDLLNHELKGLFNKELILPPLDPLNAVHLAIGKARALFRNARIFIVSNEELGDLESLAVKNLKFLSSLPSAIGKEGSEAQIVVNQDAPLKEFDESLLENVTVLDYSGEHLTIAGINEDLEQLVSETGYKKESDVLPDAPGLKKWRPDRKNIAPLGAPMSALASQIPRPSSGFAAAARAEEPVSAISGGFLKVIEEMVNPHSIQGLVDRYSKAPLAPTRHILWSGIGAVEDALAEELISIGLTVTKQAFTVRNGNTRKVLHNIIGELPGENADEIVLFTAHLDSTSEQADLDPENELAPGADDNCTGIAAVILAAKTIVACCNGRKPGRTVRFGLVNAEEIGMVGSTKYAATLDPSKVIAVLNADTLGYSGPPGAERHFEVHYGVSSSRSSNSRLELRSRAVCEVVRTMFGQLLDNQLLSFGANAMQVYSSPDPAAGRSDHASFHNVGIPAVVVSEDFFAEEGQPSAENPAYHQNTDTVIDPVYTCSIARILTASLLNLSLTPAIPDDANAFAAAQDEPDSVMREQYLDKHQYAAAAGIILDAQRVREVFGTYPSPKLSELQKIISYTEAEINDLLALGVRDTKARACGCRRFEFLRDILLICGFPRAEAEEFIREGRWKPPVSGFASRVYKTPHFAISYSVGTGSGEVLNDTNELVIKEPGKYQDPNRRTIATIPASNIPAYVRLVAYWLEHAHSVYVDTYGLRNPCDSAQDGLVPAHIVDTDFGAASPLPNGFFIGTTLTPDMVCAVSVHEYFHMIQYEYGLYGTWRDSLMEGGATYAEDGASDYLNRYLDESTVNFNQGTGVLTNPNQSIYAQDSRYKSCLFWRYIAEQESEDDAHMKAATSYKQLINGMTKTPATHQKLSELVKSLSWNKGKLPFLIAEAISIPGSQEKIIPVTESVFTDYTLACALYKIDMAEHGHSYRFQFSEWNEYIGMPEAIIPMGVPAPKKTTLADSNVKTTELRFSSTVRSSLVPIGSSYHSLDVSAANAVVVEASLASGTNAAIQIVLLARNNSGKDQVHDIIRSWTFPFKQTIATAALDRLLIVLTSTDTLSRTLVQLKATKSDANPVAQAFITNWNSAPGTHYHAPLPQWDYFSPDVSLLADIAPFQIQVVAHTNGSSAFSTYPTLRVLFTNSDNLTSTSTTWEEATKQPIPTSAELFDGGIHITLVDSVKKTSTLLFILEHADTSSTYAFSKIPPAPVVRSFAASLKSMGFKESVAAKRAPPNKHNFYETVPVHPERLEGAGHRLKFLSAPGAPTPSPAPPSPPPPEDFLNVAAWFLGPRGENKEELRKLFDMLLDSHCKWREGYFPQDSPYITNEIKETNAYKNSLALMSSNAQSLVERLRNSTPFFSCRYQGHMNWEMSAAGLIGYFATMLFNPNNVATEASPTTTKIEIDVGNQMCEMLGYKTVQGELTPWGHITSCGSVANIEGMWAARNVRFLGKAVHTTVMSPDNPELAAAKSWDVRLANNTLKPLGELTSWEILNIPTDSALKFYERLAKEFPDSQVAAKVGKNDIQHTGMRDQNIVCFVPASRHYSWDKASALLGIGQSQLRLIPIDTVGRQSVADLEVQLNQCLEKQIPVVMVVVVVGSTAQGSVDNVEKVLTLRDQFRSKGLDFYIHADAAWGGYFCSMNFTHDQHNQLTESTATQSAYVPALPLSDYVTRQLKALGHVDSITLDPHKSGWIQYPAGGLCYRNSAIRHLLSFSAPILFNGDSDPSVGIFGVEGSKPGAAVAAVYMHHQSVGLHDKGHGRLCGMANWSSKRIFAMLQQLNTLSDDVYHIVPLQPVDEEQTKKLIKIAGLTNTELRDHSDLLELLKESGSDLCINAYSINYSWPILALEGVTRVRNAELSKINQLIDNIAHDLNITYTIFDEDPYKLRNVGRKGLWLIRETFDELNFGGMDDFISRLGAKNNLPQKKLNYLVNTSMDPWPTAIGFLETYKYELRQAIFRSIGRIHEGNHLHGFVTTDAGGPFVFGNHLPVFYVPEHNYHGVALFKFPDEESKVKFLQGVTEPNAPIFGNQTPSKLYDFMFPDSDQTETVVDLWNGFPPARPLGQSKVQSTEVLIFEHFDPMAEYPEEPEFFLYGREGFAYISHCMAKFKDYHSVHQLSRVPVDVSPLLLRYGIKIKIPNLHAATYVDVDPFADRKEWEFTFIGERGVPRTSVLTVSKTVWFDVHHLNEPPKPHAHEH